MPRDIIKATPAGGYRLRLRFDDGTAGEFDIAKLISFSDVFEELKDAEKFQRVRVDNEIGTIVWPNGADLDPDVLHSHVVGKSLPVAR